MGASVVVIEGKLGMLDGDHEPDGGDGAISPLGVSEGMMDGIDDPDGDGVRIDGGKLVERLSSCKKILTSTLRWTGLPSTARSSSTFSTSSFDKTPVLKPMTSLKKLFLMVKNSIERTSITASSSSAWSSAGR